MKREIALPPTIIPGTMENQQNNMTSVTSSRTTENQQYMTNVMTPGTIENQQYMAGAYQENQGLVNGGNQNQPQAYPQSNWPQSYANTQQPPSGNQTYTQF